MRTRKIAVAVSAPAMLMALWCLQENAIGDQIVLQTYSSFDNDVGYVLGGGVGNVPLQNDRLSVTTIDDMDGNATAGATTQTATSGTLYAFASTPSPGKFNPVDQATAELLYTPGAILNYVGSANPHGNASVGGLFSGNTPVLYAAANSYAAGPNDGVASAVWSIGNTPLPGSDHQHVLFATDGKLKETRTDVGTEPANGTAVNLVAPVSGDYGGTSPIYVGGTSAGSGASPLVDFESVGDPNFTSFIIPNALPNGATEYALRFGATTVDVATGTLFDFTQYSANGIDNFYVSYLPGIVAADAGDNTFVWGATYSQDGVAEVNMISSVDTPEPATITLLASAFAAGGFGLCRRRRVRG